jgi:hypothetical protein
MKLLLPKNILICDVLDLKCLTNYSSTAPCQSQCSLLTDHQRHKNNPLRLLCLSWPHDNAWVDASSAVQPADDHRNNRAHVRTSLQPFALSRPGFHYFSMNCNVIWVCRSIFILPFSRLEFNVKHRLSGMSRVECWELSNVSVNTAVSIWWCWLVERKSGQLCNCDVCRNVG